MCGIVGFSSKVPFDKDKINQLTIVNAYERGLDATGIYSPKNGLIKNTDAAPIFLVRNNIKLDTLLMLHVRHATVGDKKKDENAHPFKYDDVTLLHNGTLKNHYDLLIKYGFEYKDFNVDSQVISAIISKENNFNVLSEIDGPAAFLIHNDKTSDILYAFRNSERPLYRGMFNESMYISSLKETLQLIGCNKIKEFKENYLYAIKDGKVIDYKFVKNAPYYKYEHTQTNYREIHPAFMYYNTWLKLKRVGYWEGRYLTIGEYYLVTDIDNTSQRLTILNDEGKPQTLSKFDFEYDNKCIIENCYVRANCDLVVGKETIATKGEYFAVIKNYVEKGSVKAFKLKDRSIITVIPKNLIDRVDADEEQYIIETYTPKNEAQLTLGFIDSSQEPLVLNDLSDIVSETTVDEVEKPEEDLIVVDKNQLVADLLTIEDRYESLYNFCKDKLVADDVQKITEEYSKTNLILDEISNKHQLINT